jgi:hypothetical protein
MTDRAAEIATAIAPEVDALLAAREAAETIRAKVDAIRTRTLAAGTYADEDTGERITVAAVDWTMSAEQFAGYNAAVLAAGRAEGLTAPEGCCPALMAETAVRDAERALIAKSEPFFGVSTACRSAKLPAFVDHLVMLVAAVAAESEAA